MINQIQEVFPRINTCLSTLNNNHTFIFEDNELKRGVIVSDNQKYHLHIENKSNSYFYFIQNDDCVMINIKNGQCDYVVFNSNDFYFIDVKDSKNSSRKSNHRKKAYDQIENTYKFYSEEIDFSKINLFGLVCFPSKRRIIKSSESTKRKEFKTKYKIDLKEENYILFD